MSAAACDRIAVGWSGIRSSAPPCRPWPGRCVPGRESVSSRQSSWPPSWPRDGPGDRLPPSPATRASSAPISTIRWSPPRRSSRWKHSNRSTRRATSSSGLPRRTSRPPTGLDCGSSRMTRTSRSSCRPNCPSRSPRERSPAFPATAPSRKPMPAPVRSPTSTRRSRRGPGSAGPKAPGSV